MLDFTYPSMHNPPPHPHLTPHSPQTIGAFAPDHTLRWGTHRPGMQPMWSPSGDMVVFDSSHDGNGWQVFAAGVAEMGAAMLPRARHGQYPWITAHDEPRWVCCGGGCVVVVCVLCCCCIRVVLLLSACCVVVYIHYILKRGVCLCVCVFVLSVTKRRT